MSLDTDEFTPVVPKSPERGKLQTVSLFEPTIVAPANTDAAGILVVPTQRELYFLPAYVPDLNTPRYTADSQEKLYVSSSGDAISCRRSDHKYSDGKAFLRLDQPGEAKFSNTTGDYDLRGLSTPDNKQPLQPYEWYQHDLEGKALILRVGDTSLTFKPDTDGILHLTVRDAQNNPSSLGSLTPNVLYGTGGPRSEANAAGRGYLELPANISENTVQLMVTDTNKLILQSSGLEETELVGIPALDHLSTGEYNPDLDATLPDLSATHLEEDVLQIAQHIREKLKETDGPFAQRLLTDSEVTKDSWRTSYSESTFTTSEETFRIQAATNTGEKRARNEDMALVFQRSVMRPDGTKAYLALAGLLDGMGGQGSGDIASFVAAISLQHVLEHLPLSDIDAITQNNQIVTIETVLFEARDLAKSVMEQLRAEDKSIYVGADTTFIGHLFVNDQRFRLQVGDSRDYAHDRATTRQGSRDHSYIQYLVDSGSMTPEQAMSSTARNKISRAFYKLDDKPDIVRIEDNQDHVLVSDGATEGEPYTTLDSDAPVMHDRILHARQAEGNSAAHLIEGMILDQSVYLSDNLTAIDIARITDAWSL